MKVLLTGASSFTGMWFASDLLEAGHEVAVVLRSEDVSSYTGIRGERVKRLRSLGAELVAGCAFGDETFLRIVSSGIDILCHHAAHVENYKSPDFDVAAAVENNTHNVRAVLQTAKEGGLRGVILTGSVFEQDEGVGNWPMRAFSPYGLSKGLSWQVFQYWARTLDVPLHKFVVPNPFGPYEEERFCAYLMRNWVGGQVAQVNTRIMSAITSMSASCPRRTRHFWGRSQIVPIGVAAGLRVTWKARGRLRCVSQESFLVASQLRHPWNWRSSGIFSNLWFG